MVALPSLRFAMDSRLRGNDGEGCWERARATVAAFHHCVAGSYSDGELLSVAFPRPSGLRIKSAMTWSACPAAWIPRFARSGKGCLRRPVDSRFRGNDGEGLAGFVVMWFARLPTICIIYNTATPIQKVTSYTSIYTLALI